MANARATAAALEVSPDPECVTRAENRITRTTYTAAHDGAWVQCVIEVENGVTLVGHYATPPSVRPVGESLGRTLAYTDALGQLLRREDYLEHERLWMLEAAEAVPPVLAATLPRAPLSIEAAPRQPIDGVVVGLLLGVAGVVLLAEAIWGGFLAGF